MAFSIHYSLSERSQMASIEEIGKQKFRKRRVPIYKVRIELFRLWLLKQRPLEKQRDLINDLFPKKSWLQGIWDMAFSNE